MSKQFKKQDRVKVIANTYSNGHAVDYTGHIGVVIGEAMLSYDSQPVYAVELDDIMLNEKKLPLAFAADELELITSMKICKRLSL